MESGRRTSPVFPHASRRAVAREAPGFSELDARLHRRHARDAHPGVGRKEQSSHRQTLRHGTPRGRHARARQRYPRRPSRRDERPPPRSMESRQRPLHLRDLAEGGEVAMRKIKYGRRFRLPILAVALTLPALAADLATVYNPKTYGAAGNGKTLDTAAIQKAIDAANAAGGGVVYFPSGS